MRVCSVPEDEDSLGLEGLFSLDEVLNSVFTVVSNLSPEVVYHEWLGEVVFIVREWHGLEVKSHHSTGLNISELVATSSGVAINVEELGEGSSVLGEVCVIAAGVPLLIVVDHVVGLRSEELVKLLVLEDLIEDPNLIDGGLSTSVSYAGESGKSEEEEMDLPDESLVEHKESESSVSNEGAGPSVVGSVKAGIDLIKVISSAHSPLPEVILEDVVAVGELVGVALSLAGLSSVGSVNAGPVVDVDVVETLGGAEAEVVVAGGGGLSEASDGGGNETGGVLSK